MSAFRVVTFDLVDRLQPQASLHVVSKEFDLPEECCLLRVLLPSSTPHQRELDDALVAPAPLARLPRSARLVVQAYALTRHGETTDAALADAARHVRDDAKILTKLDLAPAQFAALLPALLPAGAPARRANENIAEVQRSRQAMSQPPPPPSAPPREVTPQTTRESRLQRPASAQRTRTPPRIYDPASSPSNDNRAPKRKAPVSGAETHIYVPAGFDKTAPMECKEHDTPIVFKNFASFAHHWRKFHPGIDVDFGTEEASSADDDGDATV